MVLEPTIALDSMFVESHSLHDGVIKWKHFPRCWPFVCGIHRSPVNSPHTGQWRGALMFSLICAWINGWVNNSETGDSKRHRAHYDVIVMVWIIFFDLAPPRVFDGDPLTRRGRLTQGTCGIHVKAFCGLNLWGELQNYILRLLPHLPGTNELTHRGRVTHLCASKLTIIGSDNGLSPSRRQAIIWTNAGLLLIGPIGTNFSEILIENQTFSFKKMHLKMSSGKWRPFFSASVC